MRVCPSVYQTGQMVSSRFDRKGVVLSYKKIPYTKVLCIQEFFDALPVEINAKNVCKNWHKLQKTSFKFFLLYVLCRYSCKIFNVRIHVHNMIYYNVNF